MSTSIDFKWNKLLALSIVAVTVALLGTFLSYKASSSGASIEEKVLDGITATTVAWGKDSSATRILPKLKSDSVGGSKIDTETLLHLPNVSFSSLENGQALNAELKSTLASELGDGVKKRLILFGDKYDPTIASTLIRLKASGEATIKWPHIETNLTVKDLKEKESIYKGIKTTGIGFWPFNKSEISNIQSNAFPKSTIIQLEDDKYMAILSADLGLGGVNTSDAQNTGWATPPPPPVVIRVIIPATLLINGENYNLKHAGEELSNSNKDQILEENVPNGKKQTNITLSEGASHNVVGTINNIDLVCNTGYFKYYNTDSNQDVCEEEYIIPGTLNIWGKTYTIAKAGQRLTPANNQSAGTAPTPDNKGTINANIGLTKWPSKTVVGNILSQNITCQTGYIENNGGCVVQETPYTLPNAYVWPVTGITFNLTSACAWKTITASSGKQICNATVRDFGGATKTFNNSLEITVDTHWVPTVVFKNDVEKTFTVPNTITAWGHNWKVNFFSGEKMTNKWYGKFRNSSMAISVSNPWGLERAIPNGKILSNYDFTLHVDGTVDKTLNTTNRVICNPNFKAQGLACVEEWGACPNPIYLDTNGVTVKAKACAEAGKTYQWNGENWYVARDKDDAKSKIFIDNSDQEGTWTFKANRIVTSKVEDMSNMFSGAIAFNQPLYNWDVSKVKNMSHMFRMASLFNQNINDWNTSKVTDMSSMFDSADSFNQPLNAWNTNNVVDMENMFSWAKTFNQPLNNWNVSKVTDMYYMFEWARSFNQSLNDWNVSNVENMNWMFAKTDSFNQPLNNWDVSHVKTMRQMFWLSKSFNQPLNNWKVNNVTNMAWIFNWAESFNQDISNWNVSKVTTMFWMFDWATSFNQPLNNWNVSNVVQMTNMFAWATSFNQPLDKWNVSKVDNMSGMFARATSFNQPLNTWNVGKVLVMKQMFAGATSFNQPLNTWNIRSVFDMKQMFAGATSFNQNVSNWDVRKVREWEDFSKNSPINWTNKVPAKFR